MRSIAAHSIAVVKQESSARDLRGQRIAELGRIISFFARLPFSLLNPRK
ncbi:MAG TPA: hypothetical protein PLP17_06750 [Oligoflexia bacterium]|nr:hypothetical protein [Oligoflexia bacterium]